MPLKPPSPPVLLIVAAAAALACPGPAPEVADRAKSELEARIAELERPVDPIEVAEFETPPPPPEARRPLKVPALATREMSLEPLDASADGQRLRIYVFDVGQADSMLVVGPAPESRTLLFDLGEVRGTARENYLHVAQRILDITGAPHLDYLVVSHYHDDHTGDADDGIAGLIEWVEPRFTVGTFIDLGESSGTYTADRRFTYERLRDNLEGWVDSATGPVLKREPPSFAPGQIDLGTGVAVEVVVAGGRVHGDDDGAMAAVEARYPGRYERAPANENDLSIGLEIGFGEFEMFSAGDLNGYSRADWPDSAPLFTPRQFRRDDGSVKRETYTNVESHLVRYWEANDRESDVEIYRANHHGSRYSSSPELLDALDPEFVIFSTGGGHGHPERDVIERGAETANLLATTRIAAKSWETWQGLDGRLLGEIDIVVDRSGSYTITGDERPDGEVPTFPGASFTDEEEAEGADAASAPVG